MANEFFTILTAVGRNKLAAAVAAGTQLALTQMAVGDGDNGAYYNPIESQAALKHEVWRGAINSLYVDPNNANWIVAELVIPDDVGGWYIREVGLFDNTGALIAVGKFPESYKPVLAAGSNKQLYVRMILEVANTSAVTLQVDPSVVLATRQYVDSKVAGEINKLDGKQSVRAATMAAIALAGLQTIDGVVLAAGDRVLVKNQAAAADNGIYVAAAGAWTRAADADASIEVTPGLFVPVEQGTANADSIWQLVTDAPIVLGTTALAFEMVDGKTGVTAGTYRSVTVNMRGQVTGGTNPTTLAGYGITDAVTSLQGRAAGIGADLATTNVAVGDLNTVLAPGEYCYTPDNANAPSGYGLLKVWREDGEVVYQIAHSFSNVMFTRYRARSGIWTAWSQLATKASVDSAIAALVASSPAALDTLNELAAALGNDPNFAATMTNALAQKAPLASPQLTGTPTAPTAPASDNTGKLANTNWLWGNIQALVSSCIGAVANAAGFAFNTAGNGYIKFPTWLGGWIVQWGLNGGTASGYSTYSFPTTFPNGVYGIVAQVANITSQNTARASVVSASQFSIGNYNGTGGWAADGCYWFAFGR